MSFRCRFTLLLTALFTVVGGYAGEVHRKTNFIQILTDDQGWGDLGSYGHVFMLTPHIDKLSEEGLKFTNCYAAASVCSPSRAAILTGRTPYRNGVYRWLPAGHFSFLPASEITLPQLLRENGYQTAHFGKWHLSCFSETRIGETEDFKDFGWGCPEHPGMGDYGYDYWFHEPHGPVNSDPEFIKRLGIFNARYKDQL